MIRQFLHTEPIETKIKRNVQHPIHLIVRINIKDNVSIFVWDNVRENVFQPICNSSCYVSITQLNNAYKLLETL